ncbi:MAG: hypothetical protein GF384_02465 [Elusimicrobia bacterium]|nr:hypothetical protein [Elusimicrobiota bacterium]MBD3411831.1 hypothetical protein [Elusimicrobiota bacterium]
MNRIIKSLTPFFTIFFAVRILAQEPVTGPEEYFPLTVGWTWEYNTYANDTKEEFVMTVEIEKPETDNGTTYQILTQKDKRGRMRSFLEVNEEGIFVKKTGLKKSFTPEVFAVHEPAIPLFPFNLHNDLNIDWEGKLKVAWIKKDISLHIEFLGFEEITVPAGTFKCVKLYFDQTRDGERSEEYAWYARNIGQVKYIGGTYTKELTAFYKPTIKP